VISPESNVCETAKNPTKKYERESEVLRCGFFEDRKVHEKPVMLASRPT